MRPGDLQAHLDKHLALPQIETILRDDIVLVAERAGRLIGYVQFGRCAPGMPAENACELRRLYVLSDFQNQGTGTQLLRAALAHPQMQNAGEISLDVWERNDGARRLYERFGFRVIGKRKFRVASDAETDFDLIMLRSAPSVESLSRLIIEAAEKRILHES
jgi:ribosomal protein S18 acetylase RimI-like enzyme